MVSEAERISESDFSNESAVERREAPEDERTEANLAASAQDSSPEVVDLELMWMEDELVDADEVTVTPPAAESSRQPEQTPVEVQPKREGKSQLAQKSVARTVQATPAPKEQKAATVEVTNRTENNSAPQTKEKPDSTIAPAEVMAEAAAPVAEKPIKKIMPAPEEAKESDGDESDPEEESSAEQEPVETKPVLPPSNGSRPAPEAGEGDGGKEPPEKPPTGGGNDDGDEGGDRNGDDDHEEPDPGESEEPQELESSEGEEATEAATVSNEIEPRPRRDISELSETDQALLEEIQQTHGIPEEGAYGQPVIRLTTNSSDGEIRYSLRENPETHFKSVYVTGHDVAERLRGFGLGRRLLRELGHECILNGVNEIAALTANEAAVRTWLRVFGAQAVEFCDAQATQADHEGWRGKKDVLPMTPEQALASARERDASLHIRVDISRMTADYPKNKKEYDAIIRPFKLEE
jgi:GNAT superfamily N-acetyltransferase